MIKILHGADFHLDSPFDSLPEGKASERRAEQRLIVESIADLANSEKVDAVLLSGDLLDSQRCYYETSQLLLSVLERIEAPVFIAPGNHDYCGPTSPYSLLKFSENVHIFQSNEIQRVELKGKRAAIWGAGFTSQSCPPLMRGMRKADSHNMINVMAIHGTVDSPGSTYNPITTEEITRSGLDYLALGHVHSFSGFKRAGKTTYAYPGCPEGRGFDETGEKGVIIAEVSKDAVNGRFVPLGKRKYGILEIDLTGAADAKEAVVANVPADAVGDIYRVVLKGEYSGRLDLGALSDALAPSFYHVTVRDKTRLVRDIWAQAEEDTLKGLFLRKMRSRFEGGDRQEQEKIILAVRYALVAMERGEEWRT